MASPRTLSSAPEAPLMSRGLWGIFLGPGHPALLHTGHIQVICTTRLQPVHSGSKLKTADHLQQMGLYMLYGYRLTSNQITSVMTLVKSNNIHAHQAFVHSYCQQRYTSSLHVHDQETPIPFTAYFIAFTAGAYCFTHLHHNKTSGSLQISPSHPQCANICLGRLQSMVQVAHCSSTSPTAVRP